MTLSAIDPAVPDGTARQRIRRRPTTDPVDLLTDGEGMRITTIEAIGESRIASLQPAEPLGEGNFPISLHQLVRIVDDPLLPRPRPQGLIQDRGDAMDTDQPSELGKAPSLEPAGCRLPMVLWASRGSHLIQVVKQGRPLHERHVHVYSMFLKFPCQAKGYFRHRKAVREKGLRRLPPS